MFSEGNRLQQSSKRYNVKECYKMLYYSYVIGNKNKHLERYGESFRTWLLTYTNERVIMSRNERKCDSTQVQFIWSWKPVTKFINSYVTSSIPLWAFQRYHCVFLWRYVLTCLWRQQKFFGMGGESWAVAPPTPSLRIIRPNFSVLSVIFCLWLSSRGREDDFGCLGTVWTRTGTWTFASND
jgi:hypothetical protein